MMLCHTLALSLKRYDEIYSSYLPKLHLTQYIVMSAIGEGVKKSSDVGREVGLDVDLARDILHRLKKRKYVERTGEKTRLTKEGLVVLEEAHALGLRATTEYLSVFPSTGAKEMFKGLLEETIRSSSVSRNLSKRA